MSTDIVGYKSINTVDLIFKRKFKVKVPSIALKSDAELEEIGMYYTPKDMDMTQHYNEDMTPVYLTIARMVDIKEKGYPIYVMDKKTAVDIYKSIVQHLDAWDRYLKTSINIKPPPVEDSMLLDEFAKDIYNRYKSYILGYVPKEVEKHRQIEVSKQIDSMISLNKETELPKDIDLSKLNYDSYADRFAEYYTPEDMDIEKLTKNKEI